MIDPATLALHELPVFSPRSFAGQSSWTGKQPDTASALAEPEKTKAPGASVPSGNIVASLLSRGGILLLLAAFLGFGILLAFTPCVFPLYPILAAALVRGGERLDARRGFLLSSSYGLGLASAFAIFGAAAAWTGGNLQIALQSPLTVSAIAVIFALLGLSMFGLYELQLPSAWVTWLGRRGTRRAGSTGSAAVLGFSSALIVGPCVTAPLAGALLYVARTGDILLGTVLLFSLGLGKAVPLVVFGTAGGRGLPRSGAWMQTVKHIFGFVFFAFSIWMAEPVLPDWLPLTLWAALAMTVAVYLRAFDPVAAGVHPWRAATRAAGLLSAVYAVVLIVGAASGSSDPGQPLARLALGSGSRTVADASREMVSVTSKEDLVRRNEIGRSAGKPGVVYFTADWCVSCRSIDRRILSKADVADALAPFETMKVDLTEIGPTQRELMRSLGVAGPPTMIFFRPDRQEIPDGRLIGEFSAADVLAAAKIALPFPPASN